MSVSRSVCLSCPKYVGGITWPTLILKVIFGCLEMGNLKQAECQRLKTEERKTEDKT